MQDRTPKGVPPGTIQISPEEGFGPHMSEPFLNRYGEESAFVTATVDLLTWQFSKVLITAGKLPADFEPVQHGSEEMRRTLGALLSALASRGVEKPSALLMRSAVGHVNPHAFQNTADATLGAALIQRWLHLLEQDSHEAATALLAAH